MYTHKCVFFISDSKMGKMTVCMSQIPIELSKKALKVLTTAATASQYSLCFTNISVSAKLYVLCFYQDSIRSFVGLCM